MVNNYLSQLYRWMNHEPCFYFLHCQIEASLTILSCQMLLFFSLKQTSLFQGWSKNPCPPLPPPIHTSPIIICNFCSQPPSKPFHPHFITYTLVQVLHSNPLNHPNPQPTTTHISPVSATSAVKYLPVYSYFHVVTFIFIFSDRHKKRN